MKQDIYQTYIGAKGVAFAWIGAAIGPSFFVIGLEPEYRAHLAIGVVCLLFALVSIIDGFKALKVKSWSGVTVYTVIPAALMVAGVVFAVTSASSSV